MDFEKFQTVPPFTVFSIVRFFKMNNFCFKLGFLRPSTLSRFFFKDRRFFYATFSNLFSSMPPLNFSRNETFCEHKGLLGVFGTMRLTGDLHLKIPSFFLEGFRLRKILFCCFQLGKLVFEAYAYPFGSFGAVNLKKF